MKVLIIHGPNLNMLGKRDPSIYGTQTLDELNTRIKSRAAELSIEVVTFQANGEGAIIDCLQDSSSAVNGIIINPGAYGHYSYAIHDALVDTELPVIEVHLSNVHARDEWRQKSVIAPASQGTVSGFGWRSYTTALELLVELTKEMG
ncbi:type II 3-dehydroquinate dehydratase [Dehalococcoidia bacterium]|nr:type II 3-dehydroquinate dehydratase [Dehalococcoidia bacterium]